MAKTRIALFGGSFNPPHVGHRKMVEWLAAHFDRVIVVPCGHRQDKVTTNDMATRHRAVMCDMAFGGISNVQLDLDDLERQEFSSNYSLGKRYGSAEDVELWHVVGSDHWENGVSTVKKTWVNAEHVWQNSSWLILERPGYELSEGADLPPKHEIVRICDEVRSSSAVRDRLFRHLPISGMLQSRVEEYVSRHGLYLGHPISGVTNLYVSSVRPYLYVDKFNERAINMAESLTAHTVDLDQANVIIPLGGDGTMLRAVIAHWRRRLPFVGFNFGHAGHLMNGIQPGWEQAPDLMLHEISRTFLRCFQVPLLSFSWEDDSGKCWSDYAFNDVYVKSRNPTVPVFLDVEIARQDRTWSCSGVMGDGLICATEAGSTGYAYQAGAQWMPLSSDRKWLIKGICSRSLPQVNLDDNTAVSVGLKQTHFRSGVLCADNRELGPVRRVWISLSQIGSAELGFHPHTDLNAKRYDLSLGE